MKNSQWTTKKKSKVKVKTQKQLTKESYTVNDGDLLTLNDSGIEKLLGFLNNNKKAISFIYDNISNNNGIVSPKSKAEVNEQRISKYRLNAPVLTNMAKTNQKELIKNATPEELKMKLILKELNISYEFNKIYYTGFGYYYADFYLPQYNVIIEIDGKQHQKSFDKEWDALRTENLIYIHGVSRVIRIKNEFMVIDSNVKEFLLKELDIK